MFWTSTAGTIVLLLNFRSMGGPTSSGGSQKLGTVWPYRPCTSRSELRLPRHSLGLSPTLDTIWQQMYTPSLGVLNLSNIRGLKAKGLRTFTIFWPKSEFVLEVYVDEEGKKLNLGRRCSGPVEEAAHQCWKFTLCEENVDIEAIVTPAPKLAMEDGCNVNPSTTAKSG